MSRNRHSIREPGLVAGLHESILLVQLAQSALAQRAGDRVHWRGRSLFGLSSLCPEPFSMATIWINGVPSHPIPIDHARPLDNRRRILFALNSMSHGTGVTAHPDNQRSGLARIRLEGSSEGPIGLQIDTADPTEYWSTTHQRMSRVLGAVLISDAGGSSRDHLPLIKSCTLCLAKGRSLTLRLPAEPLHAMPESRRAQWSLSLQSTLLTIQTLSHPH